MIFEQLREWGFLLAFGVACVVVGLWCRAVYSPEWMIPDTTQNPPALRPWATEADCYSQLARVQRILDGQGLLQSHFTVENWPEGLDPSTTAPFDYAILLLYFPLWLFVKHPLDWAGALVSPALWVALAGFWMLIRSREFTTWGRGLLIAGSAILPTLIDATHFGRPRHQSLILVLLALGLTAEYERWRLELAPKRAWNILAGLVWGLACWTSLYEPALIVGALVMFNLLFRRRENVAFLTSFGAVLLIMAVLEGGHIYANLHQISTLTPEYRQYALNWLSTIAEVVPVDFHGMMDRLTLVLLLTPLLAWRVWPRTDGNKADAFLILLTFLLVTLTALQGRWSYYAGLAELFLVVRFCQVTPTRWTRLVALGVFFFGAIYGTTEQIDQRAQALPDQPSLELARISRSIDQPGAIMAPWWLSPGLLYFSGHPIVSGSSHCGMSGIVASAKFFTAATWPEAEKILTDRHVRWIVVWDDPHFVYPVLNASLGILGEPQMTDENHARADQTAAQMLVNDRFLPTSLHLRAVTQQMKLYEFAPSPL